MLHERSVRMTPNSRNLESKPHRTWREDDPDIAYDPIRLYLHEIGRVSSLAPATKNCWPGRLSWPGS